MKMCYERRCYSKNLLFLMVFLFGIFGCSSSSPENATEKFLSLLKEGKHLEAQDQLSTSFRQIAVGLGGGINNKNLKSYYRSDRLKAFRILNIEEEGKSAATQVELTTVNGKKYIDQIYFKKEEGKWKVENF